MKAFKICKSTVLTVIVTALFAGAAGLAGCSCQRIFVPVTQVSPTVSGAEASSYDTSSVETPAGKSPYTDSSNKPAEGTAGTFTPDPELSSSPAHTGESLETLTPTDELWGTSEPSVSPGETGASPTHGSSGATSAPVTASPSATPAETPSETPTEKPTAPPTEKPSGSATDTPAVIPESNLHFHMELRNPDDPGDKTYSGFDVYAPVKGQWGYRYAPSIIYYPDGSMDAWFATPGMGGEWDWFTYKHSDDGGRTWSKEKIVLQPTPDSMDFYSVCDPGAIYFGGYYYLGYTSTIIAGGINNNVFVARSVNPDGPYEKWNGTGWGGDPSPIIYYNEDANRWGAGEPSFVVLNGTLYMYYTWLCDAGEFKYVATADANDPNWPATLEVKGRAFTNASGSDQVDVVYVEDAGLFLAVQTANRFTESSGIQLWESKDGIHFIKGEFFKNNIAKYCHNMGISKRPDGHVRLSDSLMIGYAYSGGGGDEYWGKWATRLAYISLTTYRSVSVRKESSDARNILLANSFWRSDSTLTGLTVYDTSQDPSHTIKVNAGSTRRFYINLVTANLSAVTAALSNVSFSDYDSSIISFSSVSNTVRGLKAGQTFVTATCRGFSVTFKVIVYPEGFNYNDPGAEVKSVKAVQQNVTAYLGSANGGTHRIQVRGLVELSDGRWGEAYNDTRAEAMLPADRYGITYSSSDTRIATVNGNGIVTAKKTGTVTITGTIAGRTFSTVVRIENAPAKFNWTNSDYKW